MSTNLAAKNIIDEARQWLGTPYVHQASVKYRGCDCLGLVRGIWRELIGNEPQATPNYSSDWGEVGNLEVLERAVDKYFTKSLNAEPAPANLLLFRWSENSIIKHLGIMTTHNRFIHAYEKSGVVESSLVQDWVQRIAGVYVFPGVNN